MNLNSNRSSSSTIRFDLDEQNENQILEPLLPILEEKENSSDDLRIDDQNPSTRSICFSKLERLLCSMSSANGRSSCLVLVKWIPVIFVLSLVGWSYYAYVVQMCFMTIESVTKKVFYLIFYHVLLVLFVWSYLRTVLSAPKRPTRQFYLNETDGENLSNVQTVDERRAMLARFARQLNLPLLTRHFDGSVRYCFTCRCIKPDRAHHCSLCRRCVLRYDHHCPWTNSCISYGNYKYFVLFLGYTFVFCLFVAGSSLEYFIHFWKGLVDTQQDDKSHLTNGKFQLIFLFFVSIMFAISVSSLFFYHLYLTSKNRTTLEAFRAPIFATGPEKDGFNIGSKSNFQEIFGNSFLRSFLPIPTTRGDGIHYQIRDHLIGSPYNEEHRFTEFKPVVEEQRLNLNPTIGQQTNREIVNRSDFLVNVEPSSRSTDD